MLACMSLADRLLFEDAEALVIDKPAGLPVDAPRAGGPSVSSAAAGLRFGFARAPMPAHRLDRDTSGCLLLARNPRALVRFQAAFAQRLAEKTYLAVVAGRPAGDDGEIALALAKRSTQNQGWRMVGDTDGKAAVTRWQWLATSGGTSLLRLTPLTGRTHQLRVHCAEALGCPIIGDPVYGRPHPNGMMLHASALMVPRQKKASIACQAAMPERFVALGYGGADA